jgi:hypothetical protein
LVLKRLKSQIKVLSSKYHIQIQSQALSKSVIVSMGTLEYVLPLPVEDQGTTLTTTTTAAAPPATTTTTTTLTASLKSIDQFIATTVRPWV